MPDGIKGTFTLIHLRVQWRKKLSRWHRNMPLQMEKEDEGESLHLLWGDTRGKLHVPSAEGNSEEWAKLTSALTVSLSIPTSVCRLTAGPVLSTQGLANPQKLLSGRSHQAEWHSSNDSSVIEQIHMCYLAPVWKPAVGRRDGSWAGEFCFLLVL
jgi:hypothetical protein